MCLRYSYTEERATRDTPHRRVEWFVSETIEREFFEGRVRQKEQKICRACIVIEVQLLVTLPTYFVYRVRRPYQLGTGLGTDTSPRSRPDRPTGYEHQNKASAELSLIKSFFDRTKYLRVILPQSTEGLFVQPF